VVEALAPVAQAAEAMVAAPMVVEAWVAAAWAEVTLAVAPLVAEARVVVVGEQAATAGRGTPALTPLQ
jgi:hypothetical protein